MSEAEGMALNGLLCFVLTRFPSVRFSLRLILRFFLARNIRIAHMYAWDQIVASRSKGPAFWQSDIKEWEVPPFVDESKSGMILKVFETSIGQSLLGKCEFDMHRLGFDRWLTRYAFLFPISLYPSWVYSYPQISRP